MKNVIVMSAIAMILVLSGCNESQTVTQLKLEKAQIVKEFNETKAQMQTQIDEQATKIAELEAKVAAQKNSLDGYGIMMVDLVPKLEACKKENEELRKKIDSFNAQDKGSSIDPAQTQQKLEELKALRQKAIDQQNSNK